MSMITLPRATADLFYIVNLIYTRIRDVKVYRVSVVDDDIISEKLTVLLRLTATMQRSCFSVQNVASRSSRKLREYGRY
jgi:hypothetical protein